MDPAHFSGQELMEVAIKIEENGLRFYTEAAKNASTKKLKELFSFLAQEEKKHITDFTNLKKEVTDAISPLDPYFADSLPYLQEMADTHVFIKKQKGSAMGKKTETERKAIAIAMNMEKDSILFYYDLLKFVSEISKPILESLIQQEKEHLLKLRKISGEISKQE